MKFLPWLVAVAALAALAGFLFGSRTTSVVPESLESVVKRTIGAVVSVRTNVANLTDPEMRGTGSAFHIGDGVYVTAAHVVDGGTKIYLDNRSRTVKHLEGVLEAKLLGKVDQLDLAVLRGENIAAKLEWASQAPEIGSVALALGNPFARAPGSLTVGVISGVERLQVTPKGALAGLVQFDAQVNPGNSGGALLNKNGLVLGVVSSILSPTGSSAGVGFAIPSRLIQVAVEALVRGEKVAFPSLGVSSQDQSAVLQTVLAGGLADAAGLQAGDLILEIAGLPVESIAEVNAVLVAAKSGSSLSVKAKRNNAVREFRVIVPQN